MAALDWEQTRRDGVTLVELTVTADTTERVRIESQLQPVWPPRRQGVPATGWDDDGFEGRVDPSTPLVLGYASPATPADPPATVHTKAAGDSRGVTTATADTTAQTADGIVRALGRSTPPRDVVPTPDHPDTAEHEQRNHATASSGTEPGDSTVAGSPGAPTARSPQRSQYRDTGDTELTPDTLEPWFEAIEERLEDAEQLAGVSGADEARGAIDALGGLDAVRALQTDIEQDRDRLDRLGSRQRRLRDRLAAVDIPLATLERVA
jgi:hypothetical protein